MNIIITLISIIGIFLRLSPCSAMEDTREIAYGIWQGMPNEILSRVCTNLDQPSLLALRSVDSRGAGCVEDEFKRRAEIKTPLECLSQEDKRHSYPHTISYCLRERLRQLSALLIQPLQSRDQTLSMLNSCANFCKQWSYSGEHIFRLIHNELSQDLLYGVDLETDRTHVMRSLKDFMDKLKIHEHTDDKELYLFCLLGIRFITFHSAFATSISPTLNHEIIINAYKREEKFFDICQDLMDHQKQDIASFYLNWAVNDWGRCPFSRNSHLTKRCFEIMSSTNDNPEALYDLACMVFANEDSQEQAKEYFKRSMDKGYLLAGYYLGRIYQQEGNKNKAREYYTLSASRGNLASQYKMGKLLYKEKRLPEAMDYFLMAADQGFSMARFYIELCVKDEDFMVRAEEYLIKAASQRKGSRPIRPPYIESKVKSIKYLGLLYLERGEIEMAKRYLKLLNSTKDLYSWILNTQEQATQVIQAFIVAGAQAQGNESVAITTRMNFKDYMDSLNEKCRLKSMSYPRPWAQ